MKMRRRRKARKRYGWSYHGPDGPPNWANNYPKCGLQRQSGINIDLSQVQEDSGLTVFNFNNYGDAPSSMTLKNNGHTAQVDLPANNGMTLTGGGIEGTFKPAQFHFHWGADSNRGAEHTINGVAAPMEMHIVHYNTKYSNLSEAIDKDDGLTVLGILFEVGPIDSPEYARIVSHLPSIRYKDQSVSIPAFDVMSLLPSGTDGFLRYTGSLTTPPCHESVRYWTVFLDTVSVSENQMNAFRQLQEQPSGSTENRNMVDNFRPTQPLNGRRITTRALINKMIFIERFRTGNAPVAIPTSFLVSAMLAVAVLM